MTVQFIEVYSDIGAGKHGTTHGVAMLSEYCEKIRPDSKVHKIQAQYQPITPQHPSAKYLEYLVPFFQNNLLPNVTTALDDCQQQGDFPIIISGDHSNAMGNLAAFRNHHQDAKVGVVWIDAHADLHSIFTTPSGNMHGMPLAASLGLDNLDCQVATPNDEAVAGWNSLKQLAKTDNFTTQNLYFLGLRSHEPPEEHLLHTHDIFAYNAKGEKFQDAHEKLSLTQILENLTKELACLDAVYVSFDVDSLDSSLIPATGTPEPNGYSADEMRQIFGALLSLPNVKLFEITEFNPTLDDDTDKHQTIFALLGEAVKLIEQR